MAVEPAGDRGIFRGGVIVGDDMDVEIGRGLVIDGFEKGEPLLMAVALRQAGDQLALEIIERGKQGQGAVPHVIMGSWCEYARSLTADPAACAPAPGIVISRRSTAPAPCPAG